MKAATWGLLSKGKEKRQQDSAVCGVLWLVTRKAMDKLHRKLTSCINGSYSGVILVSIYLQLISCLLSTVQYLSQKCCRGVPASLFTASGSFPEMIPMLEHNQSVRSTSDPSSYKLALLDIYAAVSPTK